MAGREGGAGVGCVVMGGVGGWVGEGGKKEGGRERERRRQN